MLGRRKAVKVLHTCPSREGPHFISIHVFVRPSAVLYHIVITRKSRAPNPPPPRNQTPLFLHPYTTQCGSSLTQLSISLLRFLIPSSLRLATQRHRSNAPSTGLKSYFALASTNLRSDLTIVAVERYRSKLMSGSASRVEAITDGFWAL